ncbi:MAG: hypothetical protein QOG46_2059 [Pseudonocardiales bacterium]|nr:hypothetical protein [Pseudonocardiales bacterium]
MLAIGCGNDEHRVPVACLDANVSRALVRAPGDVRLEGDTKLSECFNRAAQPAEVQQVGAVFVAAAEQLSARARAAPHSPAALRLGYLIGAVRHGAGRTQGIHYETQRRIEQELIGVNTKAPEFVQGETAGERSG